MQEYKGCSQHKNRCSWSDYRFIWPHILSLSVASNFLLTLSLSKTIECLFLRYTVQESVAEGFLEAVSGPSGFLSLIETLIPELVSYFSKSISSLHSSLWQHSMIIIRRCLKKHLFLVCFKHAHITASVMSSSFCTARMAYNLIIHFHSSCDITDLCSNFITALLQLSLSI